MIIFGLLIDYIWYISGQDMKLISGSMKMIPKWLKISSSVIIILLMFRGALFKQGKKLTGEGLILNVPDMTCKKCVATLYSVLMKVNSVEDVRINLKKKRIEVTGKISKDKVKKIIKKAGYTVIERNRK